MDSVILQRALSEMLAECELEEDGITGEDLIFLPPIRRAEVEVASRLGRLARGKAEYPEIDADKAIAWLKEKKAIDLAPSQAEALRRALCSRVLVITGGPGVGKTTLVNSILTLLRAKQVKCLLCAPTGRAAKRLSESTGLEAKTIHRLLEYQNSGFSRNASNPLDCDLLVADETSMMDVQLMSKLLQALPMRAHLILVGDVDQLPSVGPGQVLSDLIASGVLPVARLMQVFRQAATSRIITTAHAVNEGRIPDLRAPADPDGCDFFFAPAAKPLNRLPLAWDTRADAEQPGCIHANMDLYRWAYTCMPWVGSDLLADCFALAMALRVLDMQAGPYDLRGFGVEPLCIETAAGRDEYQRRQRALSAQAHQLRGRLVAAIAHALAT
jgi:exodeoxyribonuclease V alpha subunit